MKSTGTIETVRAFTKLNERIIRCEKCPRLRRYCEAASRNKPKRFRDWIYWEKPLPGFGDFDAELLIVGLAPARNGGLRTGRMFCGDSSGDWLVRALYETGFANQPTSVRRDDGLRLRSAYLTAAVRCAPPANKPTREEIANCSEYLAEELRLLKKVKVVLALGRIAFESYLQHVRYKIGSRSPQFKHGSVYRLGRGLPILVASYHPSRQNTQTGKLTWKMWIHVFHTLRKLLGKPRNLKENP